MKSNFPKQDDDMQYYFVSFTEEHWRSQKEGTYIGRLEYRLLDQQYPDEFHIATHNRDAVLKLYQKYDCKEIERDELIALKMQIKEINKQ